MVERPTNFWTNRKKRDGGENIYCVEKSGGIIVKKYKSKAITRWRYHITENLKLDNGTASLRQNSDTARLQCNETMKPRDKNATKSNGRIVTKTQDRKKIHCIIKTNNAVAWLQKKI